MMLYKLLSQIDRERFEWQVISLINGGEIRKKLEDLGIKVHSLGMNRDRFHPKGIMRLVKLLRGQPPDLIQTWMYHANIVGGVIAKLITKSPIVWNIRCSKLEPPLATRSTAWVVKTGAVLSPVVPARIVCGSVAAWRDHIELGYKQEKLVVIPNGFDLERFRTDPTARESLRAELGLPSTVKLVGIVARFDPFKDPQNFVRAAAYLHTTMPDVQFVLCGHEITSSNAQLLEWIEQSGIRANCHLLGIRQDIPRLMAAMDVVVSSSQSEGFPNVLGEAMACGVPCVATDAGDSAQIVGETGKIVPIKRPEELAQACESLLRMDEAARHRLGRAAQQRIREQYSLPTIALKYEQLYQGLIASRNGNH